MHTVYCSCAAATADCKPALAGASAVSDSSVADAADPPSTLPSSPGRGLSAVSVTAVAAFSANRAVFLTARGSGSGDNASCRDVSFPPGDEASEAVAGVAARAVLPMSAVRRTSAVVSGAEFATLRCSSASFRIMKPRMMTCGTRGRQARRSRLSRLRLPVWCIRCPEAHTEYNFCRALGGEDKDLLCLQ